MSVPTRPPLGGPEATRHFGAKSQAAVWLAVKGVPGMLPLSIGNRQQAIGPNKE